jgi:DNA-directed RNA polymerase specialized sigma24 family protein
MRTAMTAEELFHDLEHLPAAERQKFFIILSAKAFSEKSDSTHEEVFGHLAHDEFTSTDAAEYLEVSTSTFRRYLKKEQLVPSSSVGRNLLFSAPALKAFKKLLKTAKG